MDDKKRKILRLAFLAAGALTLTLIVAVSVYSLWEQAPEVVPPTVTARPVKYAEQTEPEETETPWPAGRQKGVYTLLLVGNDDGNGNTDTIMVGKIDTIQHKMDFVSIPRDTLINWDWNIRKINAVYWSYKLRGDTGIAELKEHVKNVVGFEVDCYAVVDIGVVIEAIDALGGVEFDVPMDLNYDDNSQNLHIHISAGPQTLSGEQAMGVCRYRSGYYNGDLGRIDMQHVFLKACAEQFIRLGNIPNLSKVINILSEGLDTDLTAANIAFFLRQALLCKSEDVNFYTVPNTDAMVHGLSYTIIRLNEWLTMINERLNPLDSPITAEDLDIVYRDNGSFAGTAELKAPGYLYWSAPSPSLSGTGAEPAGEGETEPGNDPLPLLPEFTFPPLPIPKSEAGDESGGRIPV